MSDGFKGLVIAAIAFITAFAVGITVLVAMGQQSSAGCGGAATQPGASSQAQDSIPGNYLSLYQAAGQQYGIPWSVLAGIGKVETDHGRSAAPGVHSGANYAGAEGPMQFEPGTWTEYGNGGNIYDPVAAIPAAARLLRASGAPGNMRGAVFAYNHSEDYVNLVLSWAARYSKGGITVAGDNTAGQPCTAGSSSVTYGSPNGTLGMRIVFYASRWLGTPYQFGGGGDGGPTVGQNSNGSGKPGWDCSGLTMYAVYQASGGQIQLPHYVPTQWDNPHVQHVTYTQLQPGDLMAFNGYDHVGIYIGGGRMIDAPHTGVNVRVDDVTTGWYRTMFVTGGRVT